MLKVVYIFSDNLIRIPAKSTLQRAMRNEMIMQDYKNRNTYFDLAKKYQLTERWIREIINKMRRKMSIDH